MSWDLYRRNVDIEAMKGCVFTNVRNNDDEIYFDNDRGTHFKMYHSQDCCESVYVEDICGDLSDLIGSPIIEAECVTDTENPKKEKIGDREYADESSTWTFYKLGTAKGHVTIRWYGSSNGFYSESVDIADMQKEVAN